MGNDATDYSENSRSAILRLAILVARSDDHWNTLEREQLEGVYRNICVMLDDDLDDDVILQELETISTDVSDEIEDLTDEEDTEAYWQACLAPVVSDDIQELTVAAALTLSSADGDLDAEETSALARLCEEWDVDVGDAQDIWGD